MSFRSALFAAALICASAAHADAAPTLNPQEEATLKSFAAAHPECKEWSDGCSVCNVVPRGVEKNGEIAEMDHVACSLPGIACQPQDIACRTP